MQTEIMLDDGFYNQLELNFESPKFNPKFLHELVNDLYSHLAPDIREHELMQIVEDKHGAGFFWEKVLEKHMPHTTLLGRTTKGKDYEDFSDAKFCSLVRYNTGVFQATIGNLKNKIGTLRVCMCVKGHNYHKLYFMLVPYSYYSTLSGHPLKVSFRNFQPFGELWDKFQCSWDEVIKPL